MADPDQRSNVDGDILSKLQSSQVKKRVDWSRLNDILFEYCDRWGNPLVYIHSRDYGKQFKVQAGEGIILVGAKRDSETGGYFLGMHAIDVALQVADGNVTRAARDMGLSRVALQKKMKDYQLR